MRKCVVILLLFLTASLYSQSVTISAEKLNELMGILQDYNRITQQLQTSLDKLQTSLDSSQQRISDLQTGFAAYKVTVDTELIPKARKLESDVFWLKVGGISIGVVAVGEAVYIGGHALKLW